MLRMWQRCGSKSCLLYIWNQAEAGHNYYVCIFALAEIGTEEQLVAEEIIGDACWLHNDKLGRDIYQINAAADQYSKNGPTL